MKVYLVGSIVGSYRAQNIVKFLGDSKIPYFYMSRRYYRVATKYSFIRQPMNALLLLIALPLRVWMLLCASQVLLLPMNSTLASLLEVCLAKIFRKRVIVDFYISDYDTQVNDRKSATNNSFKGKWALFKDRTFLRLADVVIFLNRSESDYYQNVAGVSLDKNKIKIIPLCIDYRREFFEQGAAYAGQSFNVCWWGTYIPLHGLENLIHAFSYIQSKNSNLYLFGDSEEKSEPYRKLVEKLELTDRVTIINNYSFSNGKLAPFLTLNCHLAIGNFGSSEKAKTVLVNKLVDAMSLGLPCLTRSTKATREFLKDGEGIILTENSPREIAMNIDKASSDTRHLAKIGELGKKKYLEIFSPDAFKNNMTELFRG